MNHRIAAASAIVLLFVGCGRAPEAPPGKFEILEARIGDVHAAIIAGQLTSEQFVRQYFARIKAYNGTCVNEPEGILGPITTIPDAGQINALSTLNLRPAARQRLGFDERKARSMTDAADDDPMMPDALEVAVELDRKFAQTGRLVGPLHGIPIAIKDQFDTFDMRTTSGADAAYANDRPPDDATFVQRLREAGAIIIAKANMGEYASGDRSSFGGTLCNPYDTERTPGRSSGGSGSAVAANLAMCAIAEESGPSARNPGKNNSTVALAPTQELVSRDGMIPASFMNDRVGPICRTVEDVARVLDVIAGYDPKDELTAFSVGRAPLRSYHSYAQERSLAGMRIGVMREYMDKRLFTAADAQSIDIVAQALDDIRKLGAEVVDPGPEGALFQDCVRKYDPSAHNSLFIKQFPELFPVDRNGKPAADHVATLVDLFFEPGKFPDGPSIRGLGPAPTTGERKYAMNRYLRERGDSRIHTMADLAEHSSFFRDTRAGSGFSDKRQGLIERSADMTLDIAARLQTRFALQQVGLQCMAMLKLDAVIYPTSNIPPSKLGAPTEPTVNERSSNAWTLLGANGFPAITVPAGFTTEVYDRVVDATAPGGTRLVGPISAVLPVGIDFLGKPFDEPTLLAIASAYETATRHRRQPAAFGPLSSADEHQ
ncbi:MAG TPA: amidase [Povalibacter sp.]|uniref:amidase n=1 Tax=Povalibacter sp. TaxID=1962978 RepID=UPI002CCD8680|nr:amidase [Povalibacter sp.]HMN43700.1 amidase [Povalibacter sp.]